MDPADCDHDLDAEFLYPSDADVLDISEGEDGDVWIAFALPCPDCDMPLRVESQVRSVEEGNFDLPLGDDRYD